MSEALIVLNQRLASVDSDSDIHLRLPLTAEERTRLRGRRCTACGRDVLLQLPREGPLHPGEFLAGENGEPKVRVEAAQESLLAVSASSTLALLQAAYHLGNRHVALELHQQELLLLDDSVLAEMLRSRGLKVEQCCRPFDPEGGAYEGHHHHHKHHHKN
ncbi:MAG: urease accessory protein UreE [Prochlorococcus sp.]|nr:urease accessory protein UreE [Prochlorococcaceae cyanobacterium ETNP18_MAG_1]CAI8170367.1 MAG: Urease accessory protein UreE [Prochlorococcus marinus str. MIT 9215]